MFLLLCENPWEDAMTSLLVVDDEAPFLRALQINLAAHGFDVVTAGTGTDALQAATRHPLDAVVLDLGLPDMDGMDVIRGLRGWTDVPIIVLSARHGSADKVEALDCGADDYVTKPFGLPELLARLRAAVRRGHPGAGTPVVETADFTIDVAAKKVQRLGKQVRLTPTEWKLLESLVVSAGTLVGQTRLLHEVWGPAYGTETQYLRVYIGQLRRKLEPDPANPRYILTEPGMGYRFEP
jgi:two-component system KDP operon response regulator KdpE